MRASCSCYNGTTAQQPSQSDDQTEGWLRRAAAQISTRVEPKLRHKHNISANHQSRVLLPLDATLSNACIHRQLIHCCPCIGATWKKSPAAFLRESSHLGHFSQFVSHQIDCPTLFHTSPVVHQGRSQSQSLRNTNGCRNNQVRISRGKYLPLGKSLSLSLLCRHTPPGEVAWCAK